MRSPAEVDLPAERLDRPIGDAPPIVRLRAHLAKALALGPRVVLLEHPTITLDPADVRPFAETVKRVAEARRLTVVAAHRGRRLRRRRGDARLQAQWRHRRAHVDARLAPLPFLVVRRLRATAAVRYRRDAGPHRRRRLARDDARLRRDPRTRGRAAEGRPGRPHRPHHHAGRADPRRPIRRRRSGRARSSSARRIAPRCARRSSSRATDAAACCPVSGRCSRRSPVATTSGWRCSPATSAPRPRSSWPPSTCGSYFTWGAFADDAIERDDLIAVAHARHETEHGHVIEPDAVVDHRRHAARHPLRPRRRRQGGRGGDRQLRPRGAPRPPAGRAVRRPHRHRRGARRAAALSSPSAERAAVREKPGRRPRERATAGLEIDDEKRASPRRVGLRRPGDPSAILRW